MDRFGGGGGEREEGLRLGSWSGVTNLTAKFSTEHVERDRLLNHPQRSPWAHFQRRTSCDQACNVVNR
jgi:hypothetical protein